MGQVVASFIDGKLAIFDPSVIDDRPPQRAVALIEHHGDNGPVEVSRAPDERQTITKAASVETASIEAKDIETAVDRDPVSEVAALLARAAKITIAMNEADRRRARELFRASHSLLCGTTSLPDRDQTMLLNLLRGT